MKRKLLPYKQWPSQDLMAWEEAIRAGDFLSDGGAGGHWSDGSKRTIRAAYRRWLGYLTKNELEVLQLPPADRVTPDRLARYVALLQAEVTPAGVHNYVKHFRDAIGVMAPDDDWRWLHELARRLGYLVIPRNKRPRMVSSHALVELGLDLMASADEGKLRDLELAILYRDGLIIALLASRPVRRRNLAGIRIGVNLLKDTTGYRLRFEAHETKTHTLLEHPLPDWLTPYIKRYLQEYRVLFPGAGDHDGLWASAKGGMLGSQAIYDRVSRHTQDAFGHSINLHLFRDCVATTIALDDPEHVHIAADLLGHSTLEFTQRHYIQAQTREACATYQDTLQDLHRSLQQKHSIDGGLHPKSIKR